VRPRRRRGRRHEWRLAAVEFQPQEGVSMKRGVSREPSSIDSRPLKVEPARKAP
jgi:hypothetical protein